MHSLEQLELNWNGAASLATGKPDLECLWCEKERALLQSLVFCALFCRVLFLARFILYLWGNVFKLRNIKCMHCKCDTLPERKSKVGKLVTRRSPEAGFDTSVKSMAVVIYKCKWAKEGGDREDKVVYGTGILLFTFLRFLTCGIPNPIESCHQRKEEEETDNFFIRGRLSRKNREREERKRGNLLMTSCLNNTSSFHFLITFLEHFEWMKAHSQV